MLLIYSQIPLIWEIVCPEMYESLTLVIMTKVKYLLHHLLNKYRKKERHYQKYHNS